MRCYGDKPGWFQQATGGLLPVIRLDGKLITDSVTIMYALEEAFPENIRLLPPPGSAGGGESRSRAATARAAVRGSVARLAPTLGRRGRRQGSSAVRGGRDGRLEAALGERGGPYFLGAELSLVDLLFCSFVERAAASLLYFKEDSRCAASAAYPNVERWFMAMDIAAQLPRVAVGLLHARARLAAAESGCSSNGTPEAKAVQEAIDGGDWRLSGTAAETEQPLPRVACAADAEAGWPAARREAAARLIENHETVASCARARTARRGCAPRRRAASPIRTMLSRPSSGTPSRSMSRCVTSRSRCSKAPTRAKLSRAGSPPRRRPRDPRRTRSAWACRATCVRWRANSERHPSEVMPRVEAAAMAAAPPSRRRPSAVGAPRPLAIVCCSSRAVVEVGVRDKVSAAVMPAGERDRRCHPRAGSGRSPAARAPCRRGSPHPAASGRPRPRLQNEKRTVASVSARRDSTGPAKKSTGRSEETVPVAEVVAREERIEGRAFPLQPLGRRLEVREALNLNCVARRRRFTAAPQHRACRRDGAHRRRARGSRSRRVVGGGRSDAARGAPASR